METLHAPPTTGKKKKARRVFGDVAADDYDHSLSYTPSPLAFESNQGLMDGAFNSLDKLDAPNPVDKENAKNVRFSSVTDQPATTDTTKERVRNLRTFSRSPVRPDLVKKTQDAINKANLSMKNFSESILAARQAKADFHSTKRREASKIRQNWKAATTEAKTLSELTEQNRRKFLSLQRQFSSKYSREKARREQSKRQEVMKNIEKEVEFKSVIFRDHQSKLKQNEDDRRRHSVAARAKIRTNHRLGAEKIRMEKILEEKGIFEERHAASVALRDTTSHNNFQRRKSFAFRNGDARRIRQLHSNMEQKRRQQEHESFELKWQAEKDAQDHISKELQARRRSLAKRNTEGRRLRALENDIQQRCLQNQHESYELKWDAERDAKEYLRSQEEEHRRSIQLRNQEGKRQRDFMNHKHVESVAMEHESFMLNWAASNDANAYVRKIEQVQRESLAFRNAEGRRQRNFIQHEQNIEAQKMHESYELKWAAENDATKYIAKIDADRRESLANRNLEARRHRALEQQRQVATGIREHESYELKRAASKDAEDYILQQENLRRESLHGRNKERAQHAKVLDELRMLALERESESFVLKWAGENDAKDYLAKLDEERRRSLQLRGKQTLHNRQIESELQNMQLVEMQETEALRAIDRREMETYMKKCSERDRASFEYRRKEARIQRIQEAEASQKLRKEENENLKLEALARCDVVEYVNECKKRRRMSLACRAKEKRKHSEWCRFKKEQEIDAHSRRVHDQLMDQKYTELAQQKERARLALNAIRHARYTFKVNA